MGLIYAIRDNGNTFVGNPICFYVAGENPSYRKDEIRLTPSLSLCPSCEPRQRETAAVLRSLEYERLIHFKQ